MKGKKISVKKAETKLLKSGGKNAKTIRALAEEITKEANISMALVDALAEVFKWNKRKLHRAMLICFQCAREMCKKGDVLVTVENVKKELKNLDTVKTLLRLTFVESSKALEIIDVQRVSDFAANDQLKSFFHGQRGSQNKTG